MDQALADIGIISAYRFAQDGSATKPDIANLDTELADPRGWLITVASRRLTDLLRADQARQRFDRNPYFPYYEALRLCMGLSPEEWGDWRIRRLLELAQERVKNLPPGPQRDALVADIEERMALMPSAMPVGFPFGPDFFGNFFGGDDEDDYED